MAKYLRPRRGTKTNAIGQNILLKRGEIFLEFPGDTIGNSRGKLIVGDGNTSYSNINSFIEDPSIYVPKYTEYSSLSSTEAIDMIGDGSSSSTATLPNIMAAVKQSLKKIADASLANYNAATAKADTTTFTNNTNGLCPALPNDTTKYLNAVNGWTVPPDDNTTYAVATTAANGLLRTLSSADNSSAIFLRGGTASGSWNTPPDTKYTLATTASSGLARMLPSDSTSVTKFLAGDGYWRVAAKEYKLTSSYYANSTTLVVNKTAAYQAYKDLNNNLFRTKNISMKITSVAGNALGSTWSAATISGYHPIAIIGYNTGSSLLYPVTLLIEPKNSVSGVTFAVRNGSASSRAASLTARVLFLRDTV